MGYLGIDNLYNNQEVLLFKELYALEKIAGTSAHVAWKDGKVSFFSGGAKHALFVALFDETALQERFAETLGPDASCKVHGEAYGGKVQGMSATYGLQLRFVAFDVLIGDKWLSVPQAEKFVQGLGLEFVHYVKVPSAIEAIDGERDADSMQAVRNGVGAGKIREGVVLRPLIEVVKNNGSRIIAKHKRDEFKERKHVPKVIDAESSKVLTDAAVIADEWVVPMRLVHVLQELPEATSMEHTPAVIKAMVADVYKEAKDEIVQSKDVAAAIGRKTVELWKAHLKKALAGE
jgi:hypothetical protein